MGYGLWSVNWIGLDWVEIRAGSSSTPMPFAVCCCRCRSINHAPFGGRRLSNFRTLGSRPDCAWLENEIFQKWQNAFWRRHAQRQKCKENLQMPTAGVSQPFEPQHDNDTATWQSVCHPASQSASQPVHQSSGHSVMQSSSHPVSHSVSHSAG